MIKNLCTEPGLINQYIAELRDVNIQHDSLRFRRNLERVGEILANEISKTLNYKTTEVETPLGTSKMQLLDEKIVNTTILRAGLPLHQGFLNYFDGAENAFITAYRQYDKEGSFHINFEHISGPSIDGKILILSDPMLASGASMKLAFEALLKRGTPKYTHIATVIASQEGVDYLDHEVLQKHKNVSLWIGDTDPDLNEKSYIVPGLGDAGDLAYGKKL